MPPLCKGNFWDYLTESLRSQNLGWTGFRGSYYPIELKFTGYIEKYSWITTSLGVLRISIWNPPSPPLLCLNLGFLTFPKKRVFNDSDFTSLKERCHIGLPIYVISKKSYEEFLCDTTLKPPPQSS